MSDTSEAYDVQHAIYFHRDINTNWRRETAPYVVRNKRPAPAAPQARVLLVITKNDESEIRYDD